MSNKKFSFKRTFAMFIICLLAAMTLSTFAHEFTHVIQVEADNRVEPVSVCWDYGQDSAAHVDYKWSINSLTIDEKQDFMQHNGSREFIAYTIGFLTLGLFVGITKIENYW
ncbi:hypothetical protein CL614_00860 [archaeon]|nr:hypothetical protein [archaeon]